jgi:hypothetical protein
MSDQIPESIERVEFKYDPTSITKSEDDINVDNVNEKLKGNVMEVGEPEWWNLKELSMKKGIEMPLELQLLSDEHDFFLLKSNFSLMSGYRSSYEWVRIVEKLCQTPKETGSLTAYDLYPIDVSTEATTKSNIGVDIGFKFATIVEPKINYVHEVESKQFLPFISGGGIGTKEPMWDFSGNAFRKLKGWNGLYTIVKAPIGTHEITVNYSAFARVRTKWGGIIPVRTTQDLRRTYVVKWMKKNDSI